MPKNSQPWSWLSCLELTKLHVVHWSTSPLEYSWATTIYATRYPTRYPDFFPLPYPNPTRSQKTLPVPACPSLMQIRSPLCACAAWYGTLQDWWSENNSGYSGRPGEENIDILTTSIGIGDPFSPGTHSTKSELRKSQIKNYQTGFRDFFVRWQGHTHVPRWMHKLCTFMFIVYVQMMLKKF